MVRSDGPMGSCRVALRLMLLFHSNNLDGQAYVLQVGELTKAACLSGRSMVTCSSWLAPTHAKFQGANMHSSSQKAGPKLLANAGAM